LIVGKIEEVDAIEENASYKRDVGEGDI